MQYKIYLLTKCKRIPINIEFSCDILNFVSSKINAGQVNFLNISICSWCSIVYTDVYLHLHDYWRCYPGLIPEQCCPLQLSSGQSWGSQKGFRHSSAPVNFQLLPWSCVIWKSLSMQGVFESQYRRALSAGNTARSRMYMHFQKLLYQSGVKADINVKIEKHKLNLIQLRECSANNNDQRALAELPRPMRCRVSTCLLFP